MDRVIKFRAWNDIDKTMCDNGVTLHRLSALMSIKNYHVMQFTGLTDKNGAEIYEGDIVSMPYINPFGETTEDVDYLTDVFYENGCFCVFSSHQKCERTPIYNALEQTSGRYIPNHGNLKVIGGFIGKVVGNIYQDVDLLK